MKETWITDLNTLLDECRAHLRTLPPHVQERKTATLLQRLVDALTPSNDMQEPPQCVGDERIE